MPDTIDPRLLAAVGRECVATYRSGGPVVDATGTTRPDAVAARVYGILGLVLDGDGVPTGISVESDGGVALIALTSLVGLVVA